MDMLLPADVCITPEAYERDAVGSSVTTIQNTISRFHTEARVDTLILTVKETASIPNSIPLVSPGRTGPRILEQLILKSSSDATSRGGAREPQTTDWPSELGAPCNDRREQGESRLFRDLHQNNKPFGGVTFVFFGDWRQNLPVIVKGTWPRR